ncbi:MAG: hypothetical protein KDC09_13735 [Bacteroidales bacterium]|nr:hypothetical protein [Bacteroidales bacterium]
MANFIFASVNSKKLMYALIRTHKLFFSILLLVTFVFGMVENTVIAAESFELNESATYKFEYSADKSPKVKINNFFIKELAKHNLTSLRNTNFVYHYTVSKSFNKIDPNTYSVDVALIGDGFSGDVFYRNFDISDILQPDMADFTVVVVDNGNYYYAHDFAGLNYTGSSGFNSSFVFETNYLNRDYDVVIDNLEFYSSEADKQIFYDRISYIDNYYAAISAMNKVLDEMKHLNYRVSSITENFIRVSEYERIFNTIASSEFVKQLNLETNDVGGYHKKLREFRIELDNCQDRLSTVLSSMDYIELDKLIPDVAEIYVEEVSKFFVLSQNTTHSQQAYFYNLSTVKYSSSIIGDLQQGLLKILSKTKYCNDTDFVYDKLKVEIYNAYLRRADKLINDEQYHIAKGILINAENFYSIAIGQRIPLELNILLSKANYGIYNSYLHLIDRAIDIGNYELAENYIEKARNFQADNSSTIISNKYIRQVSEELVKLYINKGYEIAQDEDFGESIYCFEQAQRICVNIGQFNQDYVIKHGLIQSRNGYYSQLIDKAKLNIEEGNEMKAKDQLDEAYDLALEFPTQITISPEFKSIQSELNYQVYLKDISEGKKLLSQGNYSLAYRRLLQALELEEKSQFEIYQPLPEIFAQAATPYLVDQCGLAEVKVIKNELDEARMIYDRCFNLQSAYGLNYEPALQSSLALLNNNIFAKNCELANEDYEHIIADFNNQVESGDFVLAMETLKETEEISNQNYYCEFDRTKVAILEAKYQPAADYQVLAEEAQKALYENDRDRFVELYKEMETLSENYEVIRKRIEPMPLHYLFSVKKNLAFLEHSINDYQSEEEFNTALKILQVLQANNYTGKDTRNLQEKLAEKLAYADKESAQNADPKLDVEKYTNGDSWYKHFKKAYIKNR